MTALPRLVHRAPQMFYAAAVLFFIASVALNHFELKSTMEYVETGNPAVRIARLRSIYQGALEATYLAGNGVLAHILLAIWRNGRIDTGAGA